MARAKNKTRADGRLQSKVYIGSGKYKYVYAATSKELQEKINEIKLKLGKGIDVTAERDSFGYWAEKWLKLKKVEVSNGRYITYTARLKNLDPISYIPISKLRAADIQDIILDLSTFNPTTGKPMAKKTLKEVKQTAAQVIQLAIDNRVTDYNCALAVKIPQEAESHSKEALTDEMQRWIRETPHRAQTAAMIMLYAGLRRGELIPLLWSDIDLKAGTISVNKSVEFINGAPNLKSGGKTDAATRTVFMPKLLIKYLEPLAGNPFALVCPSAHGKLMSDTAWKRLWESYLKELNIRYGDFKNSVLWDGDTAPSKFNPKKVPMLIPEFTAHSLRHTYITMLYKAGVDVLTAKEQAGHADISTTLAIYTHLDSEFKKKTLTKLDDYLASGIGNEDIDQSANDKRKKRNIS